MRPTLACGHTEYDRGHCGIVGCDNDYFTCRDCCPPSQLRGGSPSSRLKPRNRYAEPETS